MLRAQDANVRVRAGTLTNQSGTKKLAPLIIPSDSPAPPLVRALTPPPLSNRHVKRSNMFKASDIASKPVDTSSTKPPSTVSSTGQPVVGSQVDTTVGNTGKPPLDPSTLSTVSGTTSVTSTTKSASSMTKSTDLVGTSSTITPQQGTSTSTATDTTTESTKPADIPPLPSFPTFYYDPVLGIRPVPKNRTGAIVPDMLIGSYDDFHIPSAVATTNQLEKMKKTTSWLN